MDAMQHNCTYTIRIKGHLGPQRAASFEGLTVTLTAAGETHLTGQVADQAALHGLLRAIRDAGLELLSVNRHDADENQSNSDSA